MKTSNHKIAIIGVGLIGASIAKSIKKNNPSVIIIGCDENLQHLEIALQERIIDIRMGTREALTIADAVIIATPVNTIPKIAEFCLDNCGENTWVMDTGSTKSNLCKLLSDHQKRNQLIAAHPIAGTENSGPQFALDNLFENKIMVLCETEKTDPVLLKSAMQLIESMGMRIVCDGAHFHDKKLATLSHLSHVLAYNLSKTALQLEDPITIQQIAGSGFASTVRLAKSKASMWSPIFLENKAAIIEVMTVFQKEVEEFKNLLMEADNEKITAYICKANAIAPILQGKEERLIILN